MTAARAGRRSFRSARKDLSSSDGLPSAVSRDLYTGETATALMHLENTGVSDLLFEIQTDKINVEIPSPAEGVLQAITVPEGTTLSRFDLDSSDDEGSDLDLTVYRVVSAEDLQYYQRWQSATGSADERVTIPAPTPGTYLVVANIYSTTGPMTWDMSYANVLPGGEGAFTATPNPLPVVRGVKTSYQLGWTGLTAGTRYLGMVQYGDSAVRTIVTVDAPAAADVPDADAPETEAPETEAPPTEAPETEAPPTEAPPTEAPPTEAPPTEQPE